ncbi:MAG TPA: ligase-associated DNA damage response endonuclease PdeM [Burkholderiales bacterium]|jgi:DNA ligase-associated metallophosphoesterase|nr:ligase-associated DNA damage response endonuclease PdeM [Burkholderiales bacterium]
MQSIQLAGENVVLCGDHAMVWAARRTLLVADAHFGKAAAFRARGMPVPMGTTANNLARLDALIDAHEVERVVFLGDLFHARESHAPVTLTALREWRERRADLQLLLVEGNHDLNAGAPPADLRIEMVGEPYIEGPFAFCHHPKPFMDSYVLAGHLHPAYRLSGRRESLRLPCFWLGEQVGVLPAFGDFTGTSTIARRAGDRIYAVADGRVIAMPD